MHTYIMHENWLYPWTADSCSLFTTVQQSISLLILEKIKYTNTHTHSSNINKASFLGYMITLWTSHNLHCYTPVGPSRSSSPSHRQHLLMHTGLHLANSASSCLLIRHLRQSPARYSCTLFLGSIFFNIIS